MSNRQLLPHALCIHAHQANPQGAEAIQEEMDGSMAELHHTQCSQKHIHFWEYVILMTQCCVTIFRDYAHKIPVIYPTTTGSL